MVAKKNAVMNLWQYAWDEVKDTKAADTLNDVEIGLLAADAGLREELERDGSCLEMMGLASSAVTSTSLLFKESKFHPTHEPWVGHFVRGAQAAWRLGRLINIKSCMTLVCFNELQSIPFSINKTDVEDKRAISVWKEGEVEAYGLATRALRARAKIEDGNCHWLPHYPLYRLLHLSRPKHLGDRSPRSINTAYVSPARRHEDVYDLASRISKTRAKDKEFFKFLDDAYDPVGQAIKVLADIREGELARLGECGSKVTLGRMPDPEDEEGSDGFKRVEDMAMRNSVNPFVDRLPNAEKTLEMCYDALCRGAKYN